MRIIVFKRTYVNWRRQRCRWCKRKSCGVLWKFLLIYQDKSLLLWPNTDSLDVTWYCLKTERKTQRAFHFPSQWCAEYRTIMKDRMCEVWRLMTVASYWLIANWFCVTIVILKYNSYASSRRLFTSINSRISISVHLIRFHVTSGNETLCPLICVGRQLQTLITNILLENC